MRFVWDEAKRKSNLAKHGYDFADVYRVFDGFFLRYEDLRYQFDEQRMIALGQLDAVVVVVVHVENDESIRIISLRRADKHETNLYFQNLGTTR